MKISSDRSDVLVVVLTGGIASGKTTVSNRFAELGVPVIDTDVIARRLVEPGEPALEQIVQEFGQEYLDESGHLNRAKMRKAIFAVSSVKARLEAILHPLIAIEARREINALAAPYCILVVPLLAESAYWTWIDRILVVDAPKKQQIERVMERDAITEEDARAILNSQADRDTRLKLADDIILNTGSIQELQDQINDLHNRYSTIARSQRAGG